MPVYNSLTSRADVQSLIPEQVSSVMLKNLEAQSAALSLFTRIPVSTNQTRFPVLSALPTAYFVSGDTGLKQTTEQNWANKYLNIEELAAIVPIPEAVLDDLSFDVWGSIRPHLEQAIGRALDAAVFFGVNKPASWPTDIVAGAAAASPANTQSRSSTAAQGGIGQDINLLFGKIESDGHNPNGIVARTSLKSVMRGARDTTGQMLSDFNMGTFWGTPLRFVQPGLWPTAGSGVVEAIAGDFTEAVLGVRQDFTYKIITEGVLQDGSGAIVFNLPQQDMIALRVVFRVGFQIANTINYEQPTEAARYPFGTLLAP